MSHSRKRPGGGLFNTLSSCISTTLVLLLLGIVIFFVQAGAGFSRQLRENFTLQVLVADSLTKADLYRMQTELRRLPYVRHTDYISKERGTAEMAALMKEAPSDFLGYSPIPDEFELYLKAEYACPDSLRRYVPELRRRADVADVIYPKETMNFVDYALPMTGLVMLVVAALLAFVSFALINNTIRLNVYARRFTIHTMKLVGARWSFIRRPFLVRAMGIGLVSGLLADALLGTGIHLLLGLDVYVSTLATPAVIGVTLAVVPGCGLLLTLVCAYFSVNRFLRMRGSEVFMH